MGRGGAGQLISIYPEELNFEVELEVVNTSELVKTTSPKKYFVRPNTSVVQPWDSCNITVTLQGQKELPPDLECKDKFLIQTTKVPLDALPPDTFNKEGDKVIDEMKLRVVYNTPGQGRENSEDESGLSSGASRRRGTDMLKNSSVEEIQSIQRLKEERDSTLQGNIQLQRELRCRSRRSDAGFSLTFAAFAGVVGFILNLTLSPPPAA